MRHLRNAFHRHPVPTGLLISTVILVWAILILRCHHRTPEPALPESSQQQLLQSQPTPETLERNVFSLIDNVSQQQKKAFFAISPNGRYLSYRLTKGLLCELWLVDTKTNREILLTTDLSIFTGARFSPDSRHLYAFKFIRQQESLQMFRFHVLLFNVETRRLSFRSSIIVTPPKIFWSPSGTRGLFIGMDGTRPVIGCVDLTTNKEVIIRGLPAILTSAAWSQDETHIVFTTDQKTLYRYKLASRHFHPIPLPPDTEALGVYPLQGTADLILKELHSKTREIHYLLLSDFKTLHPPQNTLLNNSHDILPYTKDRIATTYLAQGTARLSLIVGNIRYKLPELNSGTAVPIAWSPNGERLYFTWGNHNTPSRLYEAFFSQDNHLTYRRIDCSQCATVSYPTTYEAIAIGPITDTPLPALLYIPTCTKKPLGAFIYPTHGVKMSDSWNALFAILNSLGWVVMTFDLRTFKFQFLDDPGPTFWADAVLAARDYLSKRYKIPNSKIAVIGESAGGRVGAERIFSHKDEFFGLVDINGGTQHYSEVDLSAVRVRWILSFQSERDSSAKLKQALIKALTTSAEQLRKDIFIQSTELTNEGHVVLLSSSWKKIYQAIGKMLIRDNLVDTACLNDSGPKPSKTKEHE